MAFIACFLTSRSDFRYAKRTKATLTELSLKSSGLTCRVAQEASAATKRKGFMPGRSRWRTWSHLPFQFHRLILATYLASPTHPRKRPNLAMTA